MDYSEYKKDIEEYIQKKKNFVFEPEYNTPFLRHPPGTVFIHNETRIKSYEIIGSIKYITGYYRYLGISRYKTSYVITSREESDLDLNYKISLNHMLKNL